MEKEKLVKILIKGLMAGQLDITIFSNVFFLYTQKLIGDLPVQSRSNMTSPIYLLTNKSQVNV